MEKINALIWLLPVWLLFPALNANGQDTTRIANPVLPGVADAGVLHYNGEYYIGGVGTNGGFYVSSDLVNWKGPHHVFSMDNDWTEGPSADDSQIHASDIHYLNGLFHHYWSVNYWGKDRHVVHIGHATSANVLGPYSEPVKETWLANRIDPHIFRDQDGRLYMYMVKFTDGNTIWARPMKDPANFSGEPRYLFASLPGTWEARDNRVAEGPWVIRYRDQYYLMYNANHTSPRWGNYALGVAQADGPLEFNNGNKYPHPVVQSNQEDLEDSYAGTDDILFSPGQPNILRGPNGFEWWLIYMANKNAEPRGQYINRVHFFGKKLVVDGITARHTPGYHPAPAAPTFGDLFNETGETSLKNKWKMLSGSWKQDNKELIQTGSSPAAALPRSQPATNYLFEAGVKLTAADAASGAASHGVDSIPDAANSAPARAGIYAGWRDESNFIKILLDRPGRKWILELRLKGKLQTASYPLPDDFNYNAYHKLTVYKNGPDFRLLIDGIPAPGRPLITAPGLTGQGLPGLYTEGHASFDGIVYTIGWDEFDKQITGWTAGGPGNANAIGAPQTSKTPETEWIVSEEGIAPGKKSGTHSVFKGDPLDQYEFSVQVSFARNNEDREASEHAGVYAVYIDDANYLKAMFDYPARQLLISGKRKGKPLATRRLSLETAHPVYADMAYSDFIEKQFTFDTPTWINTLRFSKAPHGQPDTLLEDIHRKMNIFYRQRGQWHPLDDYREVASSHPGFEKIGFDPIKATALKLVNKQASDHHFYTYKLWTGELFRESYHLRISKLRDSLIFWVNGKEMLRMSNYFSASRVGLSTINSAARFNGITFFSPGQGNPQQ